VSENPSTNLTVGSLPFRAREAQVVLNLTLSHKCYGVV